MRVRVRENLPAAAGASVGILIVSWLGLTDWAWNDYDREARPAFDALVGGHLMQFLHLVPAYGGSLVLRAPFVLVPRLWGGGELAIFRASAAPALIASAILAVWLVARLRTRGSARVATWTTVVLVAANPITVLALESGHPEELLGAVLCAAAVLVAMADRPHWAGILLGLAIANQEWAVLAAGPVLIALPERRIRALMTAAAVTVLVLLPLVTAGGFVGQVRSAAAPDGSIFSPWQVWWFLGPHLHVIPAGTPWAVRADPTWLATLAHPVIVAVGIPLTLLCVWLRRRGAARPAQEGPLLLVLVLLVRCALDPWDNWYYPLPFLIALVTWETLALGRPPVLGLLASAAAWALFQWAVPSHGFSADDQFWFFLAFTLPAVIALAVALYAPELTARLRIGPARRESVPHPV
jgi:hypothetical protein